MRISGKRRLGSGFESLERRSLLAGDVTVFVSGEDLIITGDSADNAIAIWAGPIPKQYVVAGAKDGAGQNTLVNGQADPQTFSTITGEISLTMQDGRDQILLTRLNGPAIFGGPYAYLDIRASLGGQDDEMIFRGNSPATPDLTLNQGGAIPYGQISMTGGVDVQSGTGNDRLKFFNVGIGGIVSFTGNGAAELPISALGNDVVKIDGNGSKNQVPIGERVASAKSNVFGGMRLDMGVGNDSVQMARAQIFGDVKINDPFLSGDRGTSTAVSLFNAQAAQLSNDVLPQFVINLQDQPTTTVSLDGGVGPQFVLRGGVADTVTINNSGGNVFSIDTQGGADHVSVTASGFDVLAIALGSGNDLLEIGGVTIGASQPGFRDRYAYFDGGADTDTYTDLGGNSIATLTKINFEP